MIRMRAHFRKRRGLPVALAAAFALLLAACGGETLRARGVAWLGEPLPLAFRTASPDAATLDAAGLSILAQQTPHLLLRARGGEWGDSLWLAEFADAGDAYAAFQLLAGSPEELEAGQAVCGSNVCFRKGRWIGVLDAWSWKGGVWFDDALELPGGEPMGALPAVFGALLHNGRVRGGERVLREAFLGLSPRVPVYAVRMVCGFDTAWLYASPGLDRRFAAEVAATAGWRADTSGRTLTLRRELAEWPPAELRFVPGGMIGVEGCHDPVLTTRWLNLQKNGLKKLK